MDPDESEDESVFKRTIMEPGQVKGGSSGSPKLLYILSFLSAIGGFLFGYDTGVVSGAMMLVRKVRLLQFEGDCRLTMILFAGFSIIEFLAWTHRVWNNCFSLGFLTFGSSDSGSIWPQSHHLCSQCGFYDWDVLYGFGQWTRCARHFYYRVSSVHVLLVDLVK